MDYTQHSEFEQNLISDLFDLIDSHYECDVDKAVEIALEMFELIKKCNLIQFTT